MADISRLLGSEISALAGSSVPVIQSALPSAATQILTRTATPQISTALSQLLPTRSGSAIDGVINKNTGITLPSAKKPEFTLGKLLGGSNSLADNIQARNIDEEVLSALMDDIEGGRISSEYKRPMNELKSGVLNMAQSDRSESIAGTAAGAKSWSDLPKIRTSDIKSLIGESGADVRPSLRGKLSEKNGLPIGDVSWGEVFPDLTNGQGAGSFSGDVNDILDRYDAMYENRHAGSDFNDDNIMKYLMLNPEKDQLYSQVVADAMGGKRTIPISQLLGKSDSIPVSSVTMAGSNPAAAEPMTSATTPATDATTIVNSTAETTPITPTSGGGFTEAQENAADMLGISGGSANRGGGRFTISPASESDSGFNVQFKTEGPKTIKINSAAQKTTARQRRTSYENQRWINSVNATKKQTDNLLGKSFSFNGYYKTPVERARANNLNAANIGDRVQALIDARQNGVQQAEQYATENGVRVNLPNIEISQPQAQSLALNGVDVNTIANSGTATPIEAEQLYKMLRDDGERLLNASDGVSQEKGRAYKNMAKAVSNAINDTMDALDIDYKTALLQDAADAGEDFGYLEQIANAKDFKFSDLRSDMADLINLKDVATNKLKAGKNINIAGVDIGIPNPAPEFGERIRSKYYEYAEKAENARARAAGGAASSGATGGGGAKTGANTSAGANGGSGGATQAGEYVFENAPQSGLSALLGKARKVAPYAVAAGIGFMAGGGSNGGSDNDYSQLGQLGGSLDTSTAAQDPYQTQTIGGYNYDQLEQGYFNALAAGNTDAAKVIANLMDALENKIKRAQDSSSGSTMSAGMNVLNQLYALYKKAGGAQGVIGGNFTNLLNNVSGGAYNTDVATYNQTRALTSSLLARALGEKGTLSDTDRKYINDNLPTITDDPTVAEKKFRTIYALLEAAQ